MQVRANMPHTGPSRVLVVDCPATSFPSVLEFLQANGCAVNDTTCHEDAQCLGQEEVLPEHSPGTVLRGLRYRESLTQKEFAQRIGLPQRHISEMENNKRPIGKKIARKFADFFNIGPRVFLSV